MIKKLLMKRLLLVLLMCLTLCAPAWGANYFLDDANCVGLWTLDVEVTPAATYADTSGNGNTLANVFANIDVNTTYYQEGIASVVSTAATDSYLQCVDGSLSANFPGKNGTGNTTISACMWIRPTTISAVSNVLTKYQAFAGTYVSYILRFDASNNVAAYIGYGGSLNESKTHTGVAVAANQWYHIAWTYDGATRAFRIRVWDDNASSVTETTGTYTNTMTPAQAPFQINGLAAAAEAGMIGYIDEAVVFNDILTADEIDEIRLGTYGAPAATGTSDWWWRRRHN